MTATRMAHYRSTDGTIWSAENITDGTTVGMTRVRHIGTITADADCGLLWEELAAEDEGQPIWPYWMAGGCAEMWVEA